MIVTKYIPTTSYYVLGTYLHNLCEQQPEREQRQRERQQSGGVEGLKCLYCCCAGKDEQGMNTNMMNESDTNCCVTIYNTMAYSPSSHPPISSSLTPIVAPPSSSSSMTSTTAAVTPALLQASQQTHRVAKLVIRSLSLLGINEYLYTLKKTDVQHSMNSYNTPTSISSSCFDKTNERTLLVLLHFLLSLISPDFKAEVLISI